MTEQKYNIGGGKEIIAEYDENGIMEITRECFEALIEKQIPIEASIMKYRNDYDWTCNSCDTTFEYIRYTADKPKYCPNCGQSLKWGGDEE